MVSEGESWSVALLALLTSSCSVDAQWIVAKKDYEKAKKQKKELERLEKTKGKARQSSQSESDNIEEEPADYQPEMDQMRCILYFHGGTS